MQRTKDDLKNQLGEQIGFLKKSADLFDKGDISEAKRLALTIRVLVHKTSSQTPLLSQLELLTSTKFYNTAVDDEVDYGDVVDVKRVTSYSALASLQVFASSGSRYVPHLDGTKESPTSGKWVDFDEWWWNAIVLDDTEERKFSRKKIVTYVTDQDGGAHVDPKIGEDYAKLSRENSMGWVYKGHRGESKPVENPHLATVRQIAHEVLKTLEPEYTKLQTTEDGGFLIGGQGVSVYNKPKVHGTEKTKVGRNDPCSCGSGKKYKKCCGR